VIRYLACGKAICSWSILGPAAAPIKMVNAQGIGAPFRIGDARPAQSVLFNARPRSSQDCIAFNEYGQVHSQRSALSARNGAFVHRPSTAAPLHSTQLHSVHADSFADDGAFRRPSSPLNLHVEYKAAVAVDGGDAWSQNHGHSSGRHRNPSWWVVLLSLCGVASLFPNCCLVNVADVY